MRCPLCASADLEDDTPCEACGYAADAARDASPDSDALDAAARAELQGRFEIERVLRRDATTMLYTAKLPGSDVRLALRVFASRDAPGGPGHALLTSIATLEHPHIVPIESFGAGGGVLWYARRIFASGSLRARLQANSPMPVDACVQLAEQIAGALQHAHRKGVVHGNLHSGNVLLNRRSWPFLTDFGVSTLAGGMRDTRRMTEQSHHPSLETRSNGLATPAADQYALALLICECLGIAPLDGTLVDPEAAGRRDLSPALRETLRRAIQPRPANRFPTVLEFAAALGTAALQPGRPPAPTRTRKDIEDDPELLFVRAPERQPRRWRLAAVAAAVALAATLAFVKMSGDNPGPPLAWTRAAAESTATTGNSAGARLPAPTPETASVAAEDSASLDLGAADSADDPDSLLRLMPPPLANRNTAAIDSQLAAREREARRTAAPPVERDSARNANADSAETAEPGRLFVSSRPWGYLFIDDRLVGTTPIAGLVLTPGMHTLRIEQQGLEIDGRYVRFRTHERRILVAPGQEIRLIDIVLEEDRQ